jgi:hypothetical protein
VRMRVRLEEEAMSRKSRRAGPVRMRRVADSLARVALLAEGRRVDAMVRVQIQRTLRRWDAPEWLVMSCA